MKIFTREVKIALVAIAGVVILFFGMNFLKGLTLFSNDTGYKVMFKDITGLSNSTPIYANGFAVGVVTGIQYNYDQKGDIVVTIDLDKSMRVPQGSTAEIESDFMGNVKLNLILAPNSGQFLSPGDVIQGHVSKGALSQVGDLVPSVERLLPKLDSILASVNAILSNPAINQSLDNVQGLTANLRTSSQQLNSLVAGLNRSVPAMVGKANKVILGSSEAAIQGGITNNITWKFIDLGLTFTYQLGGDAYDYLRFQHSNGGAEMYRGSTPSYNKLEDMWKGPGDTSAKLPKFQYGSTGVYSSRWMMPLDYLRLKNLTLGFSAPQDYLRRLGLTKARVYFSSNNLLTFKSSKLYVDPEVPVSGAAGFETPQLRTYTFGVEIGF